MPAQRKPNPSNRTNRLRVFSYLMKAAASAWGGGGWAAASLLRCSPVACLPAWITDSVLDQMAEPDYDTADPVVEDAQTAPAPEPPQETSVANGGSHPADLDPEEAPPLEATEPAAETPLKADPPRSPASRHALALCQAPMCSTLRLSRISFNTGRFQCSATELKPTEQLQLLP